MAELLPLREVLLEELQLSVERYVLRAAVEGEISLEALGYRAEIEALSVVLENGIIPGDKLGALMRAIRQLYQLHLAARPEDRVGTVVRILAENLAVRLTTRVEGLRPADETLVEWIEHQVGTFLTACALDQVDKMYLAGAEIQILAAVLERSELNGRRVEALLPRLRAAHERIPQSTQPTVISVHTALAWLIEDLGSRHLPIPSPRDGVPTRSTASDE